MKSLGNCPIFLYPGGDVQDQDYCHYNDTQPWSVTDDFPEKRKGLRQAAKSSKSAQATQSVGFPGDEERMF